MASPYAKPSQQLFWDLVNRSNPQLKIPLSDDNCVIYDYPQAVTANATNNYRNTRIRLYAKQGKGYKGDMLVYYNRLSLNALFNGFAPTVTNYTANSAGTVIDAVNSAYGLNLLYDNRAYNYGVPPWIIGMTIPDVIVYNNVYASGSSGNDNERDYQAAPESLCWISTGALRIKRIRGNPDLTTLITKAELPSMKYLPVVEEEKYDVMLRTWGIDFTQYAAEIVNFAGANTAQVNRNRIAQILSIETGLPFKWGTGEASLGYLDLYGFSSYNYSQGVGSAWYYNTDDYNRCLVLRLSDGATAKGDKWALDGFKFADVSQDEANHGSNPRYLNVMMHYNV